MWNVKYEPQRSRVFLRLFIELFLYQFSLFDLLIYDLLIYLVTAVFGDCGQATRCYGCKAVVGFDGS